MNLSFGKHKGTLRQEWIRDPNTDLIGSCYMSGGSFEVQTVYITVEMKNYDLWQIIYPGAV